MKIRKQSFPILWTVLAVSATLGIAPAGFAQQRNARGAQGGGQAPAGGGGGIQQSTTVPVLTSGPWLGQRLADGQPDVSGFWSNTIANHNNFTDPQGGTNDPARPLKLGPRSERAPSRVSDPADGEIPYQPWALAKQQEFKANFNKASKPEHIEPLARCAPAGVPKSFYWHGYEIRQFPGYALFIFGSGTRLIHLDGKPHLPDSIKLWNADSRGHWEGNTLVVDVGNNNSKALFGREGSFSSENVHIVERYIFDNDNQRYNYVATFTDPSVYTRPWTATIPARRYTEKDKPGGWHYEVAVANAPGKDPLNESFERICVENNGGFGAAAGPAK
jgi:hypothetical protein